eukprot:c6003_g1_i1.p1 GENE.c6003_g1_i1~~c6003_g1_i1.p1  ORF type:complete len:765 (-),score=137.47 c6003_g1_i1:231-2477(-)
MEGLSGLIGQMRKPDSESKSEKDLPGHDLESGPSRSRIPQQNQHNTIDFRDRLRNVGKPGSLLNVGQNHGVAAAAFLTAIFDHDDDKMKKKTSMNVPIDSFFSVPQHTSQKDKLKFLLLRSLRSYSLSKIVGSIRYNDQRFPEMTKEDFDSNNFIQHKVPAIIQQFETSSQIHTSKDFQEEMLSEIVSFVVHCLDSEKFVVGTVFGDPSRVMSKTVKSVLQPNHTAQMVAETDSDKQKHVADDHQQQDRPKSSSCWDSCAFWSRVLFAKLKNPNPKFREKTLGKVFCCAESKSSEGESTQQSQTGDIENLVDSHGKPHTHKSTGPKLPKAESTPLYIPNNIWQVQVAIEFLLRELEEAEQLDMLGSWSGRVFIVNALTFVMETLFNAILVSGPAIVDLGQHDHPELQSEVRHIPVVSFVPLEILMDVAFGEASVPAEVIRIVRLLVVYTQNWVCCVRNRTVLISIEQERALANSGCVGKSIIIDAVTVAQVRDSTASDWHLIKTGQGLRAVGPDTLEAKAIKTRQTSYQEWCPLKGYPSTKLLVTMLAVAWCLATLYVLYPGGKLRPMAFPSATIIPLILADEFGHLNWAIFGDFDYKLTCLLWFLRQHVRLECNGKIIHEIRPRFNHVRRVKFILRVLPTTWAVLMLWGGWTNLLPLGFPRLLSDTLNLIVGGTVSLLWLFVWPMWNEVFPCWNRPSSTVAYIGRCETELAPPRRFFRWCDVGGPFGVVPTVTGVLVFPPKSRFYRA